MYQKKTLPNGVSTFLIVSLELMVLKILVFLNSFPALGDLPERLVPFLPTKASFRKDSIKKIP